MIQEWSNIKQASQYMSKKGTAMRQNRGVHGWKNKQITGLLEQASKRASCLYDQRNYFE
jgi:hypothetical protein